MKISVIFTGGTIGSLTNDDYIGINTDTRYMLLEPFKEKYSDLSFVTSAPYNILSENLSARELNLLQREVKERINDDPDGIIITHGTDTIQYTAAAIEYAFADTKVPIIFVSATYPLDNPLTNGYQNFEAAIHIIKQHKTGGVFVAYKNEGEDYVNIHIASRLLQHGETAADLYGAAIPYAKYDFSKIEILNPDFSAKSSPLGVVDYTEISHILAIECLPGNSFAYSLDGIKAIILKPYHSATLSTESSALREFCKRALGEGIPIFVSDVNRKTAYESSALFDELGIKAPPFCGFAALYMKIWAAVSLNKSITELVNLPLSNELI